MKVIANELIMINRVMTNPRWFIYESCGDEINQLRERLMNEIIFNTDEPVSVDFDIEEEYVLNERTSILYLEFKIKSKATNIILLNGYHNEFKVIIPAWIDKISNITKVLSNSGYETYIK